MVSGLNGDICNGKIAKTTRKFNNLENRAIVGINELKEIRAKNKKEPIEYVVVEEKDKKAEIVEFKQGKKAEIVPLNRKNIENIKERASGGEER